MWDCALIAPGSQAVLQSGVRCMLRRFTDWTHKTAQNPQKMAFSTSSQARVQLYKHRTDIFETAHRGDCKHNIC